MPFFCVSDGHPPPPSPMSHAFLILLHGRRQYSRLGRSASQARRAKAEKERLRANPSLLLDPYQRAAAMLKRAPAALPAPVVPAARPPPAAAGTALPSVSSDGNAPVASARRPLALF